jgi:ABC-type sugar transport system ATPase subunit
VTHDQEEAIALGDQIAIMRGGRVVQVGTYATLRDTPVDTFVAGFFGQYPMNLMPGAVTAAGAVDVGGAELPLPPRQDGVVDTGHALTVGLRPEALKLDFGPVHTGALSGAIESVEQDYARRLQFVRVRTQAGLLTVADASGEPLAITQRVTLTADPTQMHLFDAASGARLPPQA